MTPRSGVPNTRRPYPKHDGSASLPIEVTVAGSRTDRSAEHPWKAACPTEATPSGNATCLMTRTEHNVGLQAPFTSARDRSGRGRNTETTHPTACEGRVRCGTKPKETRERRSNMLSTFAVHEAVAARERRAADRRQPGRQPEHRAQACAVRKGIIAERGQRPGRQEPRGDEPAAVEERAAPDRPHLRPQIGHGTAPTRANQRTAMKQVEMFFMRQTSPAQTFFRRGWSRKPDPRR